MLLAGDPVVVPGAIEIVDGAVAVPTGPELGVEVDESRVEELHESYRAAGRRVRDDGGHMRRGDPTFTDELLRY